MATGAKDILTLFTRCPTVDDYQRVQEISAQIYVEPHAIKDLKAFMRRELASGIIVEKDREGVVGYLFFERKKKSIEIVDIGVDQVGRRHGAGAMLVGRLIGYLKGIEDKRRLFITMQEDNMDTLLFFKAMGFRGRLVRNDDSIVDTINMSYQG